MQGLDTATETVGGKTQRDLLACVRTGWNLNMLSLRADALLAQHCGIDAKFILVDVNTEDLDAVADLLDAQRLLVRIGEALPRWANLNTI